MTTSIIESAGGAPGGTVEGTTPYPWPYDCQLVPARVALVVCGWNAAGWATTTDPGSALAVIGRLAAVVDTVITVDSRVIRATPDDVAGPPAALEGATSVTSVGIDGFYAGSLHPTLRAAGCDHLLIAGLGLETTVHSTMRSANDRGLECLLVVDACAPHDPAMVPAAVSMIEMSGGIFGAVGRSEPVLAALRAAANQGDRS